MKLSSKPSRISGRTILLLAFLAVLLVVALVVYLKHPNSHPPAQSIYTNSIQLSKATPLFTPQLTPTFAPTEMPLPTYTPLPNPLAYGEFLEGHYQLLDLTSVPNPDMSVQDLLFVDSRLWLATQAGLWVYDLRRGSWLCFWNMDPKNMNDGEEAIPPPTFHRLAYQKPYLYAASDAGVFKINLTNDEFELFNGEKLLSDYVRIVKTNSKYVWVAYNAEVSLTLNHPLKSWLEQVGKRPRLEQGGKKTKHRMLNSGDPMDPFLSQFPFYLTQLDSEGNVVQNLKLPFIRPSQSYAGPGQYVLSNIPEDFLVDEGYVWLVMSDQVMRIGIKDHQSQSWEAANFPPQLFYNYQNFGGLRLSADADHVYLTGNQVTRYDKKTGEWGALEKELKGPAPMDQGGLVWVGSSYDVQGASRFVLTYLKDFNEGWKKSFLYEPSVSLSRVEAHDNSLWVALGGNLIQWDLEKQQARHYRFTTEAGENSPLYLVHLESQPVEIANEYNSLLPSILLQNLRWKEEAAPGTVPAAGTVKHHKKMHAIKKAPLPATMQP